MNTQNKEWGKKDLNPKEELSADEIQYQEDIKAGVAVSEPPKEEWEEEFDKLDVIISKPNSEKEYKFYKKIEHIFPIAFDLFKPSLKSFISFLIARERAETEKAFGGCKNCFGKGYSTVRSQAIGRNYYAELVPIRPCSRCSRGKQIGEILTQKEAEKQVLVKEMIEAVEKQKRNEGKCNDADCDNCWFHRGKEVEKEHTLSTLRTLAEKHNIKL